jgi:hypothetical protein
MNIAGIGNEMNRLARFDRRSAPEKDTHRIAGDTRGDLGLRTRRFYDDCL